MKIPKKVEKAIKYIAGYCNKHFECAECPLHNDECSLTSVYTPCDWNNLLNKENTDVKEENI